jgi:hypothetical protein
MENNTLPTDKELIDFYREQDYIDSKRESEELLKEAKRLNALKKAQDEVIDRWVNCK